MLEKMVVGIGAVLFVMGVVNFVWTLKDEHKRGVFRDLRSKISWRTVSRLLFNR